MVHIPRIIHQIWWQGQDKIPENLKKSHNSWKLHHPNWQIKVWDLYNMNQLIQTEYPWFSQIFDQYEYPIQRADAIRYFFLHYYGGVYVDMDLFCQKSITPVIEKMESQQLKLAFCKSGHLNYLSNWMIISTAHNAFWPQLWKEMINKYDYKNCWKCIGKHMKVMYTTGPAILNNCIQKTGVKFMTLGDGFNNCTACDPKPCKCDNCYVINLNIGGWNSWDSKLFNWTLCNWKKILLISILVIAMIVLLKSYQNALSK